MLQANQTLLVVIGEQRIDCGVMVGNGWLMESIQSIPFEPQIENLLAALHQLVEFQSAPITNTLTSKIAGSGDIDETEKEGKAASGRTGSIQVKVLISEVWLPTINLPWSQACMSATAARAYAQVQLRAAGFAFSAGDDIRLDDAPYGQPRVVVTYPDVLLKALNSAALTMKASLVSILPLSLAAGIYMQQLREAGGKKLVSATLAVIEGKQVTFVRYVGKRLLQLMPRSLSSTVSDDFPPIQSVMTQWQRIQLRDAHAATLPELYVMNLEQSVVADIGSANTLIEVELPEDVSPTGVASIPRTLLLARWTAALRHPLSAYSGVRHITPPLRGAGLVSVAILVMLATSFLAWRMTHDVETQQRARAIAHLPQPEKRPVVLSREEKSRIVAVNAAVRQLNLPVAALLQAMQPPRDIRVALLGVDLAGQSQSETMTRDSTASLKITAEARTSAEMASYVAFLAGRRPFVAAYLAHHEFMETQTEHPYRFTVEAVWGQ